MMMISSKMGWRGWSLGLGFVVLRAGASAAEPAEVDFSRDVRPILSNRCFKCHGPDEDTRKGEMRLDEAAAAMGKGESGAVAIVPGKPERSEIIKRIFSHDPDDVMPPPDAKMEMSEREREILKQWVAQGAEFREHWAFVAPVKVPLPEEGRSAVDQLVGKRLAVENLKPSEEADRHQLIRRVSLDLTGLLPTLEETEEFVNDASPDAYEKLVDRLLASPHYGERWARKWLDLARYADTNGYEKDRERSIWPWRDWVIRALNEDMPFDQFTIKQLAGDLLPEATLDDRIATGFHRNSMLNEEGGIDPLEFRFHAMTDRVATTGTTWLGLTVGCAQCHTHKYDPILHTEYFGMMAFLNNANELSLDLPDAGLAGRQAERAKQAEELVAALPGKWPVQTMEEADWLTPRLVAIESSSGEVAKVRDDQLAVFAGQGAENETYELIVEAEQGRADRMKVELPMDEEIVSGGPGRAGNGNFVLSEIEVFSRDSADGEWERIGLNGAHADREQDGYPVAAAIDGKTESGWAVQVEGKTKSAVSAVFAFEESVLADGRREYRIRLVQEFGGFHTMGAVRISLGAAKANAVEVPTPEVVAAATFEDWLGKTRAATVPWTVLRPDAMETNEPILTLQPDDSVFASGDTTKDDRFTLKFKNPPAGLSAIRLEALTDKRLPDHGPGMTYYEGTPGDFLLYRFKVMADGREIKLASASSSGPGNAGAAIDGDDLTGWTPEGRIGQPVQAVFVLAEPLPEVGELTIEMNMGRYYVATLGRFRLSGTMEGEKAVARTLPDGVEEVLVNGAEDRLATERDRLFRHFLLNAPELAEQSKAIRELLKPLVPTRTLVMSERAPETPRKTFRYNRGEFLQPLEEVRPMVPAFLPPLAPGTPETRLGFAQWLVSKENPLTARVTVNRHWHAFFGMGLTKTLDDFGFQGELPVMQELLDWLAVDFMENGWSVKKLHRTIVTSATYRQDSKVTAELLERDPENRLLARGPRVRVEAEMVRDVSLGAAGLLSRKLYGPPVRPPQPASVTEGAYGGMSWTVSQGEDRYRRALYTFAKRSAPYASFQTFDAPTGEACVARREVSNTPLQSLVLLNDEVFFEAAQALGKETASHFGTAAEKARFAFRRCLTREPKQEELEKLTAFHAGQMSRIERGELQPGELMPEGASAEETAWMTVARVLLNLDETFTKN